MGYDRRENIGNSFYSEGGFGYDDAVGITGEEVSGDEVYATDTHRDVTLPFPGFRGFARVGPQGFTAELHPRDYRGIADGTVDDDAFPAVTASQFRNQVPDQGGMQRAPAINHQDPTGIRFGQDGL